MNKQISNIRTDNTKNILNTNILNANVFLNIDNQNVLWETINKCPYIVNINAMERTNWFKYNIGIFYNNNKTIINSSNITKQQLYELNKEIIAFLVNDLKKNSSSNLNIDVFSIKNEKPTLKQQSILKKETHTVDLYNVKQKEFDNFFKNQTPTEIDFRIKDIDEPIKNINEAVEEFLKERNQDLQKYISLSNNIDNTTIQINTSKQKQLSNKNAEILLSQQPPHIKIENEIENEIENANISFLTTNTNTISNITLNNKIQVKNTQKKISWVDEINVKNIPESSINDQHLEEITQNIISSVINLSKQKKSHNILSEILIILNKFNNIYSEINE